MNQKNNFAQIDGSSCCPLVEKRALFIGRLFSAIWLAAGVYACSGSVFKGADVGDTAGGGEPASLGESGRANASGGAPTMVEVGAAGADPAAAPGGSGGNAVGPLPEASAGDPNLPDPPLEPSCAAPISEPWSEALSENGTWHVGFGDPSVDTVGHQLLLSYDDVAERTQSYAGSYYVDGDVTFQGGTVFTPYPYTFEVLLPSLRRNAAGTGIELGSTQYGSSSWSSAGWTTQGTTLPGVTTVRVTAYVQRSAKAFAVKVSSGGKVYRSAWVTDFHWTKTNLGIMRYVGENNSGVYNGGGDLIRVSALRGCQNLTDAAVEALFDN